MRIIYKIILFTLLEVFSLGGICNDTVYYVNQPSLNIVKNITRFNESKPKLSFADILKKTKQFTHCGGNDIHVPFNIGQSWFKCTIKNGTSIPQTINLDIDNSTIYSIVFYVVRNNTITVSKEMGIKYPFDQRIINSPSFIHKIFIESGKSVDCYFKIQSKGDVLNFPVKLYTNSYLFKKTMSQSILLGIIIGFIIALTLIAIYSLYINNKELTYLYFALYTIFGGLWLLNINGYTFQYLLFNYPEVYRNALTMVPLSSIYLFSQFGLKFLNLKGVNKHLYSTVLWYNRIVLLTVCIVPIHYFPMTFSVRALGVHSVVIPILNLIAALYTYKYNRDVAKNYLIANVILIMGILIVCFNIIFGFSSVEIRGEVMEIGLIFQMTVLLFALTNKIRKTQKLAEIQLEDSRQKYFDILENAIEAIFIIQKKQIKFSNTQLSVLIKYTVSELTDFDFVNIVHEEDKQNVENVLTQYSLGRSSGKKTVFRAIDKEGFEIWMELVSVPIMWEKQPATLNFMNDINLRVSNEKEKGLLEKQLLHAQKMETIGTLAGGIAHDFNNILTPIIGYTDILFSTIADEEQKDDLQNIKTSALRAKELVSQILRFSHQIDTVQENVEVNTLVKEVTKLLEAVIPSSIVIKTHLWNEKLFVKINTTQLHQVLMNICTNAYQSISAYKGRITVSVSIEESVPKQLQLQGTGKNHFVKISIEDNGCGIPAEIKSKIFDPFFTTKKVGEGTGLGLSVVYGIVKNNGGIILCYSTVDVGTRFDVLLPLTSKKNLLSPTDTIIQRGNNEEILIVDDEENIAKMLKRMIDNEGYCSTVEINSVKALELLKNNPTKFRILITDVTMPELTGIEMVTLAMEHNIQFKPIFITGRVTEAILQSIHEIPNVTILDKPIDFALLHKTIHEHLNVTII